MPTPRQIQIDGLYLYQQSVIQSVRCAIGLTHGTAFASAFIEEHLRAIQDATKKRLCGLSERQILEEDIRLKSSYGIG